MAHSRAGCPVTSIQTVTARTTRAQKPKNPMIRSKSSPLRCREAGACSPEPFCLRLPNYFTAPAVSPATILRWNTSTRITSGMVTTVPAAMTAVYGSWWGWEPAK